MDEQELIRGFLRETAVLRRVYHILRNRQILRRIDRHERIVVGRTGKSREVPLLLLQGRQER